VIRHVDAGYDEAIEVAERLEVRVPMREAADADGQHDGQTG
jgi:urocanate hydratase